MTGERNPKENRSRAGYLQLAADLRHPGCPVCRGAHRAAWQYLESFFWESVNDPIFRERLRTSHGFCREHGLLAASVASESSAGLGAAILAADLLRHIRGEVRAEVRASGDGRRRTRRGRHGLASPAACPVCESVGRLAGTYLRLLADAAPDSELGRAARRPGRAVCVPHVVRGLASIRSRAGRERLLEIYEHGDDELASELSELIRKHDYRFQDEPQTREESSSWVRAIHRLVGSPRPRKKPER